MNREQTTIPNTEFVTADGNYDTLRSPISQIIIHSTVGTVASAISVFGNPAKKTSAHYIVGNDGKLWQGLEEYNTAYHSGNLNVNRSSIGIEHEWYQGLIPSDKLYAMSAALVADICKFYGLGCNRGVVKGHKEIVATGCPNQIDVDRIVKEASAILNPVNPTPVDKWQETLQKYNGTFYEPKDVIALIEALKKENSNKDKVIGEKDKEINDLKQTILYDTSMLNKTKEIIWGKGWTWTKINTLKVVFPK
jgi:N-acetyl-anhydromuramyl-L-alanine amidase AmpD